LVRVPSTSKRAITSVFLAAMVPVVAAVAQRHKLRRGCAAVVVGVGDAVGGEATTAADAAAMREPKKGRGGAAADHVTAPARRCRRRGSA